MYETLVPVNLKTNDSKSKPKQPFNTLKVIFDNFVLNSNKFIYDNSSFYLFNGTFYKIISVNDLKKLIKLFIDDKYPNSLHPKLIDNVVELLSVEFFIDSTNLNPAKFMNFLDGVLNLETNQLVERDSSMIFTYVQPFNYKDQTEPSTILKFISSCVSNDSLKVSKLLCLAYCLLTNTTNFEVFLELVGSGSTGKSTFINLLRALIHPAQATASSLKEIENNKFESLNLEGKKLIYVADSEAYSGHLGKLKSHVSGDSVRAEKKFKGISYFSLKAIFIFAGNYSITSKDMTSGVIRRRWLIEFQTVVKKREKLLEVFETKYLGAFSPELAGFINYLLVNKNEYINKMESYIGDSAAQSENYIYNYFNECLIPQGDRVYLGNALRAFSEEEPYIYPLYLLYCKAHKLRPECLNKFIEVLKDWARINEYSLEKNRDRKGTYYTGVGVNVEAGLYYIEK